MFSFFSKKKTPETSPTDPPIPSASDESPNDNFTFIERKISDDDDKSQSQNNLYPVMPPGYPPMAPGSFGYNRPAPQPPNQLQQQPVNYLNDVPFILSGAFSDENSLDYQRSELDHVYAQIQRSNSLEEEYDFQLERSITAQ